MLVGIETLKIAGAEDRALEHWANLYVDELNVSLSRGRLEALIDRSTASCSGGAAVLLGAGALLVHRRQALRSARCSRPPRSPPAFCRHWRRSSTA